MGELFQVEYTLRVFVKYENWRKRGEGEFITLPIRIINTPRLGPTEEPFRVPAMWNPIAMNWEQVLVALPDDDDTTYYYREVYKPRWDKWHGRIEGIEKELEDAQEKKI